MTGSRSGRFFEDARDSLPVRANFIRSLQDFEVRCRCQSPRTPLSTLRVPPCSPSFSPVHSLKQTACVSTGPLHCCFPHLKRLRTRVEGAADRDQKDGILRRLTLNYAMSPSEDLLPITRARALFQSLECLKIDGVNMLPEILVCIPEMGVRTALAEMIGGEADRIFWDRVRILDNNNVAAGKVQVQLLKVLRKFHKGNDADFTLKNQMASQRLGE